MYTASLELFDQNPFQPETRHSDPNHVTYSTFITEELAPSILAHRPSRPSTLGLLQLPAARLIDQEGRFLAGLPDGWPEGGNLTSFIRRHTLRLQLAYGDGRHKAFDYLSGSDLAYGSLPFELVFFNDEEMSTSIWTENNERTPLTPMERHWLVKKMMTVFNLTQTQIAEKLKISEPTVSNILRLGQLPEDVQDRVHKGELSERAALPLITYFNLPETVRHAASRKFYIPDPVKYAKEGKASDEIRQAVNSVVQNMATSLKDIPLAQAFEGEAIITPTCRACANLLTYNQQPYCGEQTRHCYAAKNTILEAQRREQASAESGLAFKGDARITTTFSFGDVPVLPFARERHCEHLRLHQPGHSVSTSEALDPQRFPGIRLVCCNPNGVCACAQAMQATKQAYDEAYTPSPEFLARQKAEQEEAARRTALVEHFRNTLSLPTQRDFLNLLTANDVLAWRVLLNEVTNKEWREIEPLTQEQCLLALADHLIDPSNWAIIRDTDDTVARLNRTRTRLGLDPLELPEPENATPAEKLLRQLERIEGWWENAEEYPPDYEAVEGNIANLDKLHTAVLRTEIEDPEPRGDLIARIVNLRDGLQAWLDEADANQDPDEDEEPDETLHQYYVGVSDPA